MCNQYGTATKKATTADILGIIFSPEHLSYFVPFYWIGHMHHAEACVY